MSKAFGFSHDDARRFYNRFGARQDAQGFYENAALDALIRLGRFGDARSVLEVGCGTGKFATRLLSDHLPPTARYTGIDISETMVRLAGHRLGPWSDRATAITSDGGFDFASFGMTFDRVIFTYVLDLLSEDDLGRALGGAHAVAEKGGVLCAAGLTHGPAGLSRATSAIWAAVHRVRPSLVGGCRPLVLSDRLDPTQWRLSHKEIVVRATIASEVVVAEAV